jgi:ABC-type transporter Mla subunit MlaD
MEVNGTQPNGKKPSRRSIPSRLRPQHNVRLAAIVFAILIPLLYLGFTKNVPFTSGFQVNAVFKSANSIRPGSPVRVAGVNVGKVVEVTRYKNSDSANVKMELDEAGLPVHTDAQLKIRPRIFLEGNFFVDLSPGTPDAPNVSDGGTIPVTQTSTPVQLDQILTSLQFNTREDLQVLLTQLGVGLNTKPTPAENAKLDPEVQNTTGGEALNRSLKYSAKAEKSSAIVSQGFLGNNRNDLSGFIRGLEKTTTQLGANQSTLADFVTNFNATLEAFGSNQADLANTIRLLGPTVTNTYAALGNLNTALPAISQFSTALLPGVNQTLATTNAGVPWAKQAGLLMPQLEQVTNLLKPTTLSTAQTVAAQIKFLPETRALAQCFTYSILPTGDQVIKDGPVDGTHANGRFSSDQEAYKSFWFGLVGLAGESQNFDGNGQFLRAQPGGAEDTQAGGSANPGHLQINMNENNSDSQSLVSPLNGNMPNAPLGNSPRYFGRAKAPDYAKPGQLCVPSNANLGSITNVNSFSNNPYLVDLNKTAWAKGDPDPVAP